MAKEETVLNVAARRGTGKQVAKRLRREEKVPAVVYGPRTEPEPLEINLRNLLEVAEHSGVIRLQYDDQRSRTVLLRDIQRNFLQTHVLHADFLEVAMDEPIVANVPIVLTGHAAGLEEGGVVDQVLFEVDIEALPGDIPEELQLDVTALNVGDNASLTALVLPEGVKLAVDDVEATVVTINTPTEIPEEEEEGEEPTEPELIGAEGEEGEAGRGEEE